MRLRRRVRPFARPGPFHPAPSAVAPFPPMSLLCPGKAGGAPLPAHHRPAARWNAKRRTRRPRPQSRRKFPAMPFTRPALVRRLGGGASMCRQASLPPSPVTRHGSMRRSGLRAQRNRFHPRGTAATEAHVSFRLSVCASLRWRLRRGHFDVIQRPRCARGRRAGDCARCPRPQARLRQATEQLGRSSPQPCTHQGNGEPWPRGRRGERRTPPAVRQLAAPRWEAAGRFRTWQWRRRQWLWSPVCRAMPARSVSNKAVRPRSAADGARQHTCAPCNPEPGVRVLSPCASTPRRSPSVCLCALGRVCV